VSADWNLLTDLCRKETLGEQSESEGLIFAATSVAFLILSDYRGMMKVKIHLFTFADSQQSRNLIWIAKEAR
jgi:hypothetical protein